MTIELDWGNSEETLLIWTCDTNWTAEEYYEAVNTCVDMIDNQPHPVTVMVDVQFNRMRPMLLLQLAKYGFRNRSNNVNAIILIYGSGFWLFFEEMLQAIFGSVVLFLFAKDANEAYSLMDDLPCVQVS